MAEIGDIPPGLDATRPTSARSYDYFLGGSNNFPVDREAAERLRAAAPDVVDAFFANRGFHGRAAVWMARQGIRQFIDLGSGLPTQNNTHESVRKVVGDARVPSGSPCARGPRWSGCLTGWNSCPPTMAPSLLSPTRVCGARRTSAPPAATGRGATTAAWPGARRTFRARSQAGSQLRRALPGGGRLARVWRPPQNMPDWQSIVMGGRWRLR